MSLLFRYMLRLTYVKDGNDIDSRLVGHLEKLKESSANKRQEWIRNALRDAFIQEELILIGNQPDTIEREHSQSDV